jgi:hypothetical protein
MSSSTIPLAESVQTRLESISMRLDAATDNLLQTRDLLIRNLEHQMLQLQEVRSALHEAALETSQWAAQSAPTPAPTPAPAPLQPAVKPMGELTLESLFAPLNAVPRATPPSATIPESVIEEVPFVNAEVIFESEPTSHWQPVQAEVVMPAEATTATAVEIKPVTQSGSLNEIDPALEKATLDELNEALTRAFAQIANRHASN